MHAVRTELLQAQAAAAGLPLMMVQIPHPCPNEVYEAQMSAAIASAKAQGFTHVAFGDLFLEDIRGYREERMKGTGLVPIFPLWMRPTDELAREMIRSRLEAYLTCVDPRVPAGIVCRPPIRYRARLPSCRRVWILRRTRRVSHVRSRGTDVQEPHRGCAGVIVERDASCLRPRPDPGAGFGIRSSYAANSTGTRCGIDRADTPRPSDVRDRDVRDRHSPA
jgi:hypothetical protein